MVCLLKLLFLLFQWSINVAKITEVAPVALLPNIVLQKRVLKPFRYVHLMLSYCALKACCVYQFCTLRWYLYNFSEPQFTFRVEEFLITMGIIQLTYYCLCLHKCVAGGVACWQFSRLYNLLHSSYSAP